MKKIINGKSYNTDTAKTLGTYDNGYSNNDFDYCYEELYVKHTGEFFLLGIGGARSKYSMTIGNSYCGGSEIVPLTVNEAKSWVEKHLTYDKYAEIFGEHEE